MVTYRRPWSIVMATNSVMDWPMGCWGGRAEKEGDSKDGVVTMLGWDF